MSIDSDRSTAPSALVHTGESAPADRCGTRHDADDHPQHRLEHRIDIDAPAEAVFELLADVTGWPSVFGPTVHAETDGGQQAETIRLWATANGDLKAWSSRRLIDREQRTIEFRQVVSSPPVRSMVGTWEVHDREPSTAELGGGASTVVLRHVFEPDETPGAREWIERAVDTNSERELASLAEAATVGTRQSELAPVSFADSVWIDGTPDAVREVITRAELWPERLGHVAGVTLSEDVPGQQLLRLETRAPDGSTHTTTSWRVLLDGGPDDSASGDNGASAGDVVYKQIGLPVLLDLHLGRWSFRPDNGGTIATSEHTVRLSADGITTVFGPDGTAEQAHQFIRNALGANSTATLNAAKALVEQAVAAT